MTYISGGVATPPLKASSARGSDPQPVTQPVGFPDLVDEETGEADILRLMAIGSLAVVNGCRDRLYILGYAKPYEWSDPIPVGNPGKVMRVLTKRFAR